MKDRQDATSTALPQDRKTVTANESSYNKSISASKLHRSSRALTNHMEERERQLEHMKAKFNPIDFGSIKRHEQAFMAEVYMRKQQKELEAKEKRKEVENIYKGSKTYQQVQEEFKNQRNSMQHMQKRVDGLEQRERIKKYTEKLKTIQNTEERVNGSTASIVNQLPKKAAPGAKADNSVYGRFGKQWEKKLNQIEDERKYLEEVKEKGNEYMKFSKSKIAKSSIKNQAELKQHEEDERIRQTRKSQEVGNEYMKFAKAMAAKNQVSETNELIIPGQGGLKHEEKAAVLAKLEKMESDIHMIEAKVRNKAMDKDSSQIEEVYLKNIRAKLSLLEDI